jgi:cell division protein FtsB
MKRILYLIVVVGLILVNNSLIHSVIELWNKQNVVKEAQIKLDAEKAENTELKNQLSYVQTNAFIENEARDKLFLVKPGESEVLISKDLLSSGKPKITQAPKPVWQQWVDLFTQ